MRRSLTLIGFVCIFYGYSIGADYFFQAVEDHLYENPANWLPTYPGAEVRTGDRVVLMENVSFVGYDIVVNGYLEIGMGVSLISGENGLLVSNTGTVDNSGEILVKYIESSGRIANQIAARIHLFNFHAFEGAITHNSASATFVTLLDLENQGRFDNYGICKAGNDFRNHAFFYQIRYANLDVRGNIILSPGSVLTHSPQSTVVSGKLKKFLISDRLPDEF
ncbi:MAG: hypothetical protein R3D00_07750 [Bacteroidia bacterium]